MEKTTWFNLTWCIQMYLIAEASQFRKMCCWCRVRSCMSTNCEAWPCVHSWLCCWRFFFQKSSSFNDLILSFLLWFWTELALHKPFLLYRAYVICRILSNPSLKRKHRGILAPFKKIYFLAKRSCEQFLEFPNPSENQINPTSNSGVEGLPDVWTHYGEPLRRDPDGSGSGG